MKTSDKWQVTSDKRRPFGSSLVTRHSSLAFIILCLAGLFPQGGMMAQPQPGFTGIQRLTNRETLLRLGGATGVSYRIDAATNLPDWSGLLTLFSTG